MSRCKNVSKIFTEEALSWHRKKNSLSPLNDVLGVRGDDVDQNFGVDYNKRMEKMKKKM